jgi:electron transport complex protein RnfE
MKKSLADEFLKGVREQIPPFKLVLGLCPALAVTRTLEGGLGMGIATTFVLVMSNAIISSVKTIIPDKIRITTYIIIIATFVVITELLMKAYTPKLSDSLGVFIPLIVVNCIILGRAEAFASKNSVVISIFDGLGIGTGYTLSLTLLGAIREFLGTGGLTVFSEQNLHWQMIPLSSDQEYLFKFMAEPPGAFVTLGIMLVAINMFSARKTHKKEMTDNV